tara:strand:+ start:409 stop:648 length:240 start_codon:yes stop_codon:yes gene_type:complete
MNKKIDIAFPDLVPAVFDDLKGGDFFFIRDNFNLVLCLKVTVPYSLPTKPTAVEVNTGVMILDIPEEVYLPEAVDLTVT